MKVTSEDKQYSKTYTVLFTPTEIPAHFGFEYWAVDGKYEKSYEHGMTITNDDGTSEHYPEIDLYLWDSGNLGFSAVASGKGPKEYPTFSTDDAYSGSKAAKLVTRKTGTLGATLNKPIAAGNIFLGEFSGKGINLMAEPLKATRFGLSLRQDTDFVRCLFQIQTRHLRPYRRSIHDSRRNSRLLRHLCRFLRQCNSQRRKSAQHTHSRRL